MHTMPQVGLDLQPHVSPRIFDQIEYITSALDTVVVLSRRYRADLEDDLRHTGAWLKPRPRVDLDSGQIWWWPYHLKETRLSTCRVIERWKPATDDWPGLKINRVDIPINIHMRSWNAKLRMRDWLATRLRLKRISKHASRYWIRNHSGDTLYVHDTRHGKKPARTVTLYDCQFREEPNVLRLELRYQTSDAVRRNGLDDLSPTALHAVNPREHLRRHLALMQLDPAWVDEQVRREVRRLDRSPLHSCKWIRHVPAWVKGHLEHDARLTGGRDMPVVRDSALEALLDMMPTRLVMPE